MVNRTAGYRFNRWAAVRLAADRRGVAAAEFALLVPVLSVMLAAIWQYGTLTYSYNVIQNAARNGARALALGTATPADVTAAVNASLPPWVPAAQATVTALNPAIGEASTRIVVPARYATMMPIGPMPTNLDVTVSILKDI